MGALGLAGAVEQLGPGRACRGAATAGTLAGGTFGSCSTLAGARTGGPFGSARAWDSAADAGITGDAPLRSARAWDSAADAGITGDGPFGSADAWDSAGDAGISREGPLGSAKVVTTDASGVAGAELSEETTGAAIVEACSVIAPGWAARSSAPQPSWLEHTAQARGGPPGFPPSFYLTRPFS